MTVRDGIRIASDLPVYLPATKGQSGAPNINYEIPDKAKDYDFDFQFVPDGE